MHPNLKNAQPTAHLRRHAQIHALWADAYVRISIKIKLNPFPQQFCKAQSREKSAKAPADWKSQKRRKMSSLRSSCTEMVCRAHYFKDQKYRFIACKWCHHPLLHFLDNPVARMFPCSVCVSQCCQCSCGMTHAWWMNHAHIINWTIRKYPFCVLYTSRIRGCVNWGVDSALAPPKLMDCELLIV